MTTVTRINQDDFAAIRKEFSVDKATGIGYVSLRGLSRLCGVAHKSWGKSNYVFSQEIDQMLSEQGIKVDTCYSNEENAETIDVQGLQGGHQRGSQMALKNAETIDVQGLQGGSRTNELPSVVKGKGKRYLVKDTVAALVIKHYAYKGNTTAQATDMMLSAIGLRSYIQTELEWKPERTLTKEEIVQLLCLPIPTDWTPRFQAEYYAEMSRLTGLKPQGHKRPKLWANLTYRWIYAHLPSGVYEQIKAWQTSTDPNKKLHQYLSDAGIDNLKKQLELVLPLMKGSSSWKQTDKLLEQATTKQYQFCLFG